MNQESCIHRIQKFITLKIDFECIDISTNSLLKEKFDYLREHESQIDQNTKLVIELFYELLSKYSSYTFYSILSYLMRSSCFKTLNIKDQKSFEQKAAWFRFEMYFIERKDNPYKDYEGIERNNIELYIKHLEEEYSEKFKDWKIIY